MRQGGVPHCRCESVEPVLAVEPEEAEVIRIFYRSLSSPDAGEWACLALEMGNYSREATCLGNPMRGLSRHTGSRLKFHSDCVRLKPEPPSP